MKYKYIIFDVDDTLLNYEYSEERAYRNTMNDCGIEVDDNLWNLFNSVSDKEWAELKLHNTEDLFVQENYHKLYYQYGIIRFEKLKEDIIINKSAEELSELYYIHFSKEKTLNPHAKEVCEQLSKNHQLMIATNGLQSLQTSRLSELRQFFTHVFISEQVGYIKPSKNFFDHIITTIGIEAGSQCLMVGDSVTSDMKGALSVGMDTCWYNPTNMQNNSDILLVHEIRSLSELLTDRF